MQAPNSRKVQGRVRERRATIIQIMRTEGSTSVSKLAARLHCSPVTIRRDLTFLVAEGQGMTRYHGVAAARGVILEQWFQDKMEEAPDAKTAIAEMAAGLIEDGTVIGLNGGTTTMRIAEALVAAGKRITVVTNAVNIAMILTSPRIQVVVVGGGLRPSNYETTGVEAVHQLERLHLEWAFLGANGVHVNFGISTSAAEEASVGAAFARAADRVVVVADARKFGQTATHQMLAWPMVDMLISDPSSESRIEGWQEQLNLGPPARGPAVAWMLRNG